MTYYEIENELEVFLKSFPKDRQPTCLSYWNSGSDYKEKLAATVKLCGSSDLFDYQYFFPDSIKKEIAKKGSTVPTLITTFGLKQNAYASAILVAVVLDDLFANS